MLARAEGWEARLNGLLAERNLTPFAWGANDCCSFAIEAVKRLAGCDVWPVTWTDEISGRSAIEAAGGLFMACSRVLGRPSQNWHDAWRGDIGLLDDNQNLPALAVCSSAGWAMPGPDSLAHRPWSEARYVWRIGH